MARRWGSPHDGLHPPADGKVVAYVRQPEEVHSGPAAVLCDVHAIGGMGTGLLVESHGAAQPSRGTRFIPPVSCDGHSCAAAILNLYDPDRSRALTHLGEIRPLPDFLAALASVLTAQQASRLRGLRILTESISSPTLGGQLQELLSRYPSARWHQWEPASHENARAGARLAFGEFVDAQLRLDQADVILALDADFLGGGAGSLKYARDFSARRRPELAERMNRLYALESMPTSTGARADHRFPVRPSEVRPSPADRGGPRCGGRRVGRRCLVVLPSSPRLGSRPSAKISRHIRARASWSQATISRQSCMPSPMR